MRILYLIKICLKSLTKDVVFNIISRVIKLVSIYIELDYKCEEREGLISLGIRSEK